MGARTKARKRALDLLFEAEQRGVNARDLLDERVLAPVTPAPLPEYTAVLVRGVVDNWRSINEALEVDDVPDGVAVSEAKNLATELSTDNSPQFIGGLLTKLSEVKSSLVD